jgi:hypothetical protein
MTIRVDDQRAGIACTGELASRALNHDLPNKPRDSIVAIFHVESRIQSDHFAGGESGGPAILLYDWGQQNSLWCRSAGEACYRKKAPKATGARKSIAGTVPAG